MLKNLTETGYFEIQIFNLKYLDLMSSKDLMVLENLHFLKILSGFLTPTEGEQKLQLKSKYVSTENWSNHIAYAAPYYELIEEMYLEEFVSFYVKFKPLQKGISQNRLN